MRIFFILISLIAMDAWLTKAMLAQSSAAKGVGPAIQMVPAIKVLPGVSSQPKVVEERSTLPGRSVVPAGAESTLATPATLTTPTNAPAAKPSRSVLLSQAFLKQSFDRRPSVILETLRGFDTGKDSPGDASANAETESEQKDETQMLKDAIGQELRILSRQVTLGQWEAVRFFSGPWKLSPCKPPGGTWCSNFRPDRGFVQDSPCHPIGSGPKITTWDLMIFLDSLTACRGTWNPMIGPRWESC